MTVERNMRIDNEHGLHLRAAAMVAQTACDYIADIKICYGKKSANAKSTIGIMTLGAPSSETILVQACGDDADCALNAIETLLCCEAFTCLSTA